LVYEDKDESEGLMQFLLEQPSPRLDRFLTDQHPEVPRSRWEIWIREGHVQVNGQAVSKRGTRLRAGDRVETELPDLPPPAADLLPEQLDLPTLYEDARLWIVDKPAGMVVHPGPGHASGTVVNALLGRLVAPFAVDADPDAEEGDEEEISAAWPGLVHRLDRYTTGCLALAKDAQAMASLQAQFKARTVEKRYLALARNSRKLPEIGSLLVDQPILRHRVERLKMTISAAGRPSQTRFRVLARARGLALVECELLTGRTHQIRVHLSHLGAPILGDTLYGGAPQWQDEQGLPFPCEHPALHAWKLALDHPGDGRRLELQAPLPQAFKEILERIGMVVPSLSV
jgi:23S rRNA pseudouridine1911/1915/1917 synthase